VALRTCRVTRNLQSQLENSKSGRPKSLRYSGLFQKCISSKRICRILCTNEELQTSDCRGSSQSTEAMRKRTWKMSERENARQLEDNSDMIYHVLTSRRCLVLTNSAGSCRLCRGHISNHYPGCSYGRTVQFSTAEVLIANPICFVV
jgi:hypothetical protein